MSLHAPNSILLTDMALQKHQGKKSLLQNGIISFTCNKDLVTGDMPKPKDDRVVIDAPFCLNGEGRLRSVAEIAQKFILCYFKKSHSRTGTRPGVSMTHVKEKKETQRKL